MIISNFYILCHLRLMNHFQELPKQKEHEKETTKSVGIPPPVLRRNLTENKACCFKENGERVVGVVQVDTTYKNPNDLFDQTIDHVWVHSQDKDGRLTSRRVDFT